ncbi:MAG: ethylbenzene dehydrogenase-related protein [Thermodesulfobacteriota bacterium]
MLLPALCGAKEIDWDKVGSTRIVLFYPGVASWEFLNSEDHRLGSRDIKRVRKDCRHCHLSKEGELDLKADEIAGGTIRMKRSHKPFEPEPIPGKAGTMRADVKAAYDSDYLYVRVEWASKGMGWRHKKAPGSVPDRVSMQLNARDKYFRKYGCFIACHNDLNTMPDSPSKKAVRADAYYRRLGRDDVRLYAFYTKASWSDHKRSRELDRLVKVHGRMDLRSIELEDGRAVPLNGWVFNDRVWEDAGAQGSGVWAKGKYVTVFKLPLNSRSPFDVKVSDGGTFSTGFAIHEDGAQKRKHYVSFPYTVGLGAGGVDIQAVKLR